GNVTDTTVLDTTIGSPSVTIDEDINNDGFINDAELDGQIDITVALSAGTAVGDTLVVTDQAGNTLFSGPVTQAMLDSGLSVTMNPPATGTNVTVTATVTDPAGNTSSNSDTALLTNATDDSITVDEDNVASGNVLANDGSGHINVTGFTMDTNGDNVEESFAVNTNVTVAGGTLIINSDGGYSFTPAPDWNGVLPVITYTTNTGDTATLTITVDSVSDPVVA
ncbi:Ig-like domain-containing protein, partial [Shewanella hanedai]